MNAPRCGRCRRVLLGCTTGPDRRTYGECCETVWVVVDGKAVRHSSTRRLAADLPKLLKTGGP